MTTSKNKKNSKKLKRKQQVTKKRKSNTNFSTQMKSEVKKLIEFIEVALNQVNTIDKEFKRIATEKDCMDIYNVKSKEYLIYKEKLEDIKIDLSNKFENIVTLEGMTKLLLTFTQLSTDTIDISQKIQSSVSNIVRVDNNKLVFSILEGEENDPTRTETTH
jgi:hypothetical protein